MIYLFSLNWTKIAQGTYVSSGFFDIGTKRSKSDMIWWYWPLAIFYGSIPSWDNSGPDKFLR